MNSTLTILIPAIVAALTAGGAVIGIQFRNVDSYERRRGFWLWLLVLLAAIATAGAINSASGVGQPAGAIGMTVVAAGAVIISHVLWRRQRPDADQRTRTLATAAAGLALVVLAAAVTATYVSGKGCRQASPLIEFGAQHGAYVLPLFGTDPAKRPPVSEYDDWAKQLRRHSEQVTDGDLAPRAKDVADLAEKIAGAVRANDTGAHAMLGTRFYEELRALIRECHPQS